MKLLEIIQSFNINTFVVEQNVQQLVSQYNDQLETAIRNDQSNEKYDTPEKIIKFFKLQIHNVLFDWLTKEYALQHFKLEDIDGHVRPTLKLYKKYKKDIQDIHSLSLSALYQKLKELKTRSTPDKNIITDETIQEYAKNFKDSNGNINWDEYQQHLLSSNKAKLVHRTNDISIIQIFSKEAAIWFGRNSNRWCTSYTNSENLYKQYKEGDIFVIMTDNEKEIYQAYFPYGFDEEAFNDEYDDYYSDNRYYRQNHYEDDLEKAREEYYDNNASEYEVTDVNNEPITLHALVKRFPIIKDIFKNYIKDFSLIELMDEPSEDEIYDAIAVKHQYVKHFEGQDDLLVRLAKKALRHNVYMVEAILKVVKQSNENLEKIFDNAALHNHPTYSIRAIIKAISNKAQQQKYAEKFIKYSGELSRFIQEPNIQHIIDISEFTPKSYLYKNRNPKTHEVYQYVHNLNDKFKNFETLKQLIPVANRNGVQDIKITLLLSIAEETEYSKVLAFIKQHNYDPEIISRFMTLHNTIANTTHDYQTDPPRKFTVADAIRKKII